MNLDEYRGIYRREDFVKKFTEKIKLQTLPPNYVSTALRVVGMMAVPGPSERHGLDTARAGGVPCQACPMSHLVYLPGLIVLVVNIIILFLLAI